MRSEYCNVLYNNVLRAVRFRGLSYNIPKWVSSRTSTKISRVPGGAAHSFLVDGSCLLHHDMMLCPGYPARR